MTGYPGPQDAARTKMHEPVETKKEKKCERGEEREILVGEEMGTERVLTRVRGRVRQRIDALEAQIRDQVLPGRVDAI